MGILPPGIVHDLSPASLRRLAAELYREHVRLLERADALEARLALGRELARHRFPLSRAQLDELRREARNLAISRDARAGVTTRALAARYGLSASRVRTIVRGMREDRVRLGRDMCLVCRGPVEAMTAVLDEPPERVSPPASSGRYRPAGRAPARRP